MTEFPHIAATLEGPVPDLLIAAWSALAAEHVASGFYSSFTTFERMFPAAHHGPLSCAVANTAPHAWVLEVGHAGFHLPTAIAWGSTPHAHMSARGVPYLRIPLRHGTPGAQGVSSERARTMMPAAVYRDALALLRGGRDRRLAAAAHLREAGPTLSRPYAHQFPHAGDAKTAQVLGQLRQRALREIGQPGYTWKAGKYEGLRGYAQQSPVTGKRSTAWTTFRTLTADSLGWFIPPHPGYHFAARTVERVAPEIRALIAEAAREDVIRLVGAEVAP